jgi:alanine dehydrogenase
MLLGGVPGVAPAKIAILGGGVAGEHAARIAIGHRADVILFEISPSRIAELDAQFDGRLKILFSTREAIAAALREADLVVGAVLVPGAKAPKLVARADLATMKKGAVLVDIAIDQGGCFETSRPTTHADPTYDVDGIIHYCVANMPGAAPLTATYALSAATAPYVERLAGLGVEAALAADPGFAAGLNVKAGKITYQAVADALGL